MVCIANAIGSYKVHTREIRGTEECANDENLPLIPEKCISCTAAPECTESLTESIWSNRKDNMLLPDKLVM